MLQANQQPRLDIHEPGDTTKAELLFELLEEYGMTFLPWQQLVLRRWLAEDENGNFTNLDCGLSVPRQNGKMLHEMTEIPTTAGWKKMKDIKIGDYVFGDDGKPTKVIAKYEPNEENYPDVTYKTSGDKAEELKTQLKAEGADIAALLTAAGATKVTGVRRLDASFASPVISSITKVFIL